MLLPGRDFLRLSGLSRKARRRGDPVAADRWMRLAERQLRMLERIDAVANEIESRNLRRQRGHSIWWTTGRDPDQVLTLPLPAPRRPKKKTPKPPDRCLTNS